MKMKTKGWVPVSVLLWIFCGWSSINGDVTAVDAAVTLQQQSLGDLDNDDGNRHGSASSDASGMNPLEQQAKMYEARIRELSDSIVTLEDSNAQLMNIAERRRVMQNSTSRSRDEGYRATTANTQRRQKSVKKYKEDTTEAPAEEEEEEEEDSATISPSASPSSPMIQPKCLPEKNLMEVSNYPISPSLYMNWSFNRAMSAITIGSKSNTTNPATTYTILGNGQGGPTAPSGGSLNGFTVTAATYNADANANAAGVSYGVETQINQQSSTMSVVTAITIIVPYAWDLNLASFQPDITNSDVIYFLVGCTDGNMWLCNINPSTTGPTQANCDTDAVFDWFSSNNHITGTISEIAYIPQSNTVVVMTFQGALTPFSVVFDATKPTLSPGTSNMDYMNDDPQNLYVDGGECSNVEYFDYALFLPRSVAVVYINSDTTYLYVAGLYPTASVPGYSCEGNYAAPLMIFTMDADRTISYTGSISNTQQTYQVIPVLTGIYFTSYGNMVSYIPFVQPTTENPELAPNGMLGSNPAVYTVYAAADSYHLVTSIAFSANPSNVVIYVDPTNSSTPEYAFEDGALFINVATVDNACSQGTRPHWEITGLGLKSRDVNVAGNTCFGSIVLSDACTGKISLVVENEIPGPVYTSLPGLNMDMFGQNGQGGLTFFSVAYTPGIVGNAALVTNQAFEALCECSTKSNFVKDLERFVAVALLVCGVVALPGVAELALPAIYVEALNLQIATYGLISSTAGVATSFIGVIPNQPYCGGGDTGNGQCVGNLCCSESGSCVTCPTPAPAPTPPPSVACSIEFGPCTAGNYNNVFETRCCDNSQLPGSPIVTCNAEYGQCQGQGVQDGQIYTPWAQCSTNQFGINFCEDWCNVSDYWPNCGTNILDANDSRNTGTSDYVCSCTGCNGCDSSSSIQQCSTDQFNINFCDDWCNVRNLWPNCGTNNTVTQRTGQEDLEYGTTTYEYTDYTCSCNGCNGCPA